jgi:hypothetical protein
MRLHLPRDVSASETPISPHSEMSEVPAFSERDISSPDPEEFRDLVDRYQSIQCIDLHPIT